MKKSLIGLLSVMVVLAFTASAFALHQVKSAEYTPGLVKSGKSQITLGGEIRIRGNFQKNTDFNDDTPDTQQKYDQRVRLSTKANVTDKTMGVVELETGTKGSSYNWGGTSNSKIQDLSIRQAYISHQFGSIGGIKAGHMLLALGNRLFFDHTNYGDDALLGWVAAGPGEVSLIDIKLAENDKGGKLQNDDTEAYVLAVEMPVGPANVSADLTYILGHDKSTYDKGTKFYNLGVRADADLKVVKVKGDIEIQSGKDTQSAADAFGNTSVKYQGYAAMLGVEANVGPASIRGGAAYGSGDKVKDNGDSEGKDEGFHTYLTDSKYSTFVYDYSVKTAAGAKHTGLNNTMFLNVGASVKPIAELKISADAYYLRAAQNVENGAGDKTKKLGYELDGKVKYQLASNLVYYVEAGMLFAGEAYDSATEKSDNPYRVRHGLLLKF